MPKTRKPHHAHQATCACGACMYHSAVLLLFVDPRVRTHVHARTHPQIEYRKKECFWDSGIARNGPCRERSELSVTWGMEEFVHRTPTLRIVISTYMYMYMCMCPHRRPPL
eukprot:gene25216-biopygen17988